ncbi:MAG: hypothetical protein WCP00_01460 [bacterium]
MIFQYLAVACLNHGILGLPTWYQYLNCNSDGAPIINNINDIWSIAAAIIDILLKLSALIAVGITIYGGAQYMTSSGNAEKTNKAKNTIISAAIGLLICSISITVVHFVAGSFH